MAQAAASTRRPGRRSQEKSMREYAMTMVTKSGSSGKDRELAISAEESNSQRALDRRLDQALEDTFPASDPVAIVMPAGSR
jgi:hypothetical protein